MAQGQRTNRALVQQARQGLDQLKQEVASELGIQYPPDGYWGDLPSRVNGAVGGNMVRRMIAAAEQSLIDQAAQGVRAGFTQGLQQAQQPQNWGQQSQAAHFAQQGTQLGQQQQQFQHQPQA